MNAQEPRRANLVPDPLSNALKTGTEADCPRVPEDMEAIHFRTLEWYDVFRPQNPFHCYLIQQVVVTSLRIDHSARIDRRSRDRGVLQAKLFWDDERRLEAEVLGAGLSKSPATVVNQLRRTPQGCDWMICRWSILVKAAEDEGGWDETMNSLAFDLLGVCLEARHGKPGEEVNPGTFALGEIASLQDRKGEVAGIDALDRSMAEADYQDEPTSSTRSQRRHDAEMHRRLKWFIAQLNLKPLYPLTNTKALLYYNTLFAPLQESAQPAAESVVPSSVVEAEIETPDVVETVPDLIPEIRPVPEIPSKLPKTPRRKAGSRRENRERRPERLRA